MIILSSISGMMHLTIVYKTSQLYISSSMIKIFLPTHGRSSPSFNFFILFLIASTCFSLTSDSFVFNSVSSSVDPLLFYGRSWMHDWKIDPLPRFECTATAPPNSSEIIFEIDKPNPTPFVLSFLVAATVPKSLNSFI